MMRDLNKVILLGKVGADPAIRQTQKGKPVANFSVATHHRVYAADQTKEMGEEEGADRFSEATQWHHVVAWGGLAELCSQFVKKGERVMIEGSIRTKKWQSADGTERVSFEVQADEVIFLGGSRLRELSRDENSEPIAATG
jgi:single-strand DNA-binding protein